MFYAILCVKKDSSLFIYQKLAVFYVTLLRRSKATYSYGTRQSRQPQPEPDVDPNTAEIRLRDGNSTEANALQKP